MMRDSMAARKGCDADSVDRNHVRERTGARGARVIRVCSWLALIAFAIAQGGARAGGSASGAKPGDTDSATAAPAPVAESISVKRLVDWVSARVQDVGSEWFKP